MDRWPSILLGLALIAPAPALAQARPTPLPPAPPMRSPDGPDGAGDLDPTFGFAGRWTWAAPEGIRAGGVAVAPDGELVAVGGYDELVGGILNRYLHWKRFTAAAAGTTCVADAPGQDLVGATVAAFDSAGRLIVAGGTNGPGGGALVYLARSFYPACALDATFDGDGIVVRSLPETSCSALALDVFPVEAPPGVFTDRILVLGGEVQSGGFPRSAYALRLLGSGAVDTSWGSNGYRSWVPAGGGVLEETADAARDGSGRLLVAGRVDDDFWISRRLANGNADATFGGDGDVLVAFDRPPMNFDEPAALDLYPDGRILVAGRATASAGDDRIAVARLLSSGALDPSFGAGGPTPGKVLIAIDSTPPDELEVHDAKIQSDGGIVVIGGVQVAGDEEVFAVRLDETGALDPSFGGDGRVVHAIDLGGTLDDRGIGLTFQSGRPVLIGEADQVDSQRGILLRLQSALIFADGFESGDFRAWSSHP